MIDFIEGKQGTIFMGKISCGKLKEKFQDVISLWLEGVQDGINWLCTSPGLMQTLHSAGGAMA